MSFHIRKPVSFFNVIIYRLCTMKSANSTKFIAPILGCLAALGPLAIDMYLPALPQMASALNTNNGSIQYSLMVFFAGLTIGQLFYGPLSDRFGRKPLIFFGLMLFTLSSLGCVFVLTLKQLLLFRFFQGLGGSIGMVIAMAVIRDLYTGHQAMRLMAIVLMVLGISPILAPLAGSLILSIGSWQAMFIALTIIGAAIMLLAAFMLPETRLSDLRKNSHPSDALKNYLRLLISKKFMPFVLVSSIAQGGFFAYISGSASVFISLHGLSPSAYSFLFAGNAIGLVLANQLSPHVVRRFGTYFITRLACGCYAICGVLLIVQEITHTSSLLTHSALLFVVVSCVGFLMPILTVQAMASYGSIAGTAAALLGAIQFIGASTASGVVGSLTNGTAIPLMGVIAVCGIAALLVSIFFFPKQETETRNSH
jgi:DHA1 family bicyclomycin/chloramphenicol resistance-like MFS transporter